MGRGRDTRRWSSPRGEGVQARVGKPGCGTYLAKAEWIGSRTIGTGGEFLAPAAILKNSPGLPGIEHWVYIDQSEAR
jgi:hypothetical protein